MVRTLGRTERSLRQELEPRRARDFAPLGERHPRDEWARSVESVGCHNGEGPAAPALAVKFIVAEVLPRLITTDASVYFRDQLVSSPLVQYEHR